MCAVVTYKRNGKIERNFLHSVFVTSDGTIFGYIPPYDFPVLVSPDELIDLEELVKYSETIS